MESFVKQYVKQETEFEQLNKENQGRIDLLEKTYEKKLLEGVQLREMKRNNTNKINVLDNENIDLEKVGNRIYDIVKEISSKKAPEMEETRN